MKSLKLRIDGDLYDFTTLSIRQRSAVTKEMTDPKFIEKFSKLQEKESFGEITAKEITQLLEYQEKDENNKLGVLVKSLAKEHPEFRVTETQTEEQAKDRVKDMFDVEELERVFNFVMSGRYVRPEKLEDDADEEV